MTATHTETTTVDQVAEAELFCARYDGSFGFILDMQRKVLAGERLSANMVTAILRCKVREDERNAVAVGGESLSRLTNTLTEEGIYLYNDSIYKVQRSASGRLYAKMLVSTIDANGRPHGRFEYAAGMVRWITADMAVTQEQAAAFGHRFSFCCFCGIFLSDDRSVSAGYGPVCAHNRGLAWG